MSELDTMLAEIQTSETDVSKAKEVLLCPPCEGLEKVAKRQKKKIDG